MKNTAHVNGLSECTDCKLKGFFCVTPNGGDYSTCPSCNGADFMCYNSYEETRKILMGYANEYEHEFELELDFEDDDMREMFPYCNKCNIIFELGCTHAIYGCTDSIYNCHFIKKWRDKTTNIAYVGMPKFENEMDWYNNVNNVEVLEMYCPHAGAKCKKSHDSYYNRYSGACWLKK